MRAAEAISHKIIRNTVYNSVGRFWAIAVGFVLTPYIISHIGPERFGVWAIVGVITGYFGLLDFGIGFSFVKYITEYHTRKEYDNLNGIVNTGFTLYAALALVGVALVFLLRAPLLTLLNVPPYLRHEAAIVLAIGVALFGASNTMSPLAAVQAGLQRMDISNNISVAVSFVQIAGTVWVLEKGYGLIGLMANNAVVLALTFAANGVVAFRILPELRFRPLAFHPAMFRKLFGFGMNVQVSKISGMVANQTDKLFIAGFLSIGLVTYYQLGSTVVVCLTSVLAILTSAIMPAFSEIEATGDRPRLVEAYLRSVKYLSFFSAPLFLFVMLSAYDIMHIWMGQGFEKTAPVIQLLAGAWLLATIAQISVCLTFAIERPQYMSFGSLIVVSLNLVLSFIFIKAFGFYGAAWGTLFAINIGVSFFLYTLHRHLRIPVRQYARATLPYIASGLLTALVVALADHLLKTCMPHPGRVRMLSIFAGRAVAFAALYVAVVIRFRLLTRADLDPILRRAAAPSPVGKGPR